MLLFEWDANFRLKNWERYKLFKAFLGNTYLPNKVFRTNLNGNNRGRVIRVQDVVAKIARLKLRLHEFEFSLGRKLWVAHDRK